MRKVTLYETLMNIELNNNYLINTSSCGENIVRMVFFNGFMSIVSVFFKIHFLT